MKNGILQIFYILSKIIYIILVVLNIVLPTLQSDRFGFGFWQVAVTIIWTYGILSSMGYFKKIVSQDEDGKIEYMTSVPFLQVGIARVLQLLYSMWRLRSEFILKNYIILVAFDVALAVVLLLDKSTYCYESTVEVNNAESGSNN